MTGLILIGLLPFAALGIVFGHLLTPDSIGPAMGGATALLAILGGTWFPITGGDDDEDRRGAAVLLARPGGPCRARRPGLDDDRLDRHRRLDGRRRRSSPAGPTGATRGGSSAVPLLTTDGRSPDASSGSSQATACRERLRVGRLEHDLDLGPVGHEARVGADRDVGQRTVALVSRWTMSLSRVLYARRHDAIGLSPRSSSA